MFYSIGEVAKMFNLPSSTIRYYDSEGLFPNLKRESGIRKFSNNDLEGLRVIECLKKSGLEIKDIKLFMQWVSEGPKTYSKRQELINKQKERIEEEIRNLNKALDMLKYKSWYYQELVDGKEEKETKAKVPNLLPEDIRIAYENAHK